MVRVLTFGTFDKLHPGHSFHLHEAKKHGDELYVIVARDETVEELKGQPPKQSQEERRAALEQEEIVTKAVIGYPGDKLKIVEEIHPDVICIGYDQTSFTNKLKEKLAERGLHPKIVKFNEGFHPDMYKSSRINPLD